MKPYYSDDSVTIYHADCREVLPELDPVPLTLTDLPYGNGTQYGAYEDTPDNLSVLVGEVLPQLREMSEVVLLTPGIDNMWSYPRPEWVLCWAYPKGNGSSRWGFNAWQPVLAYGADPYLRTGQGRRPDTTVQMHFGQNWTTHPCPKPVKVMRWMIERGSLAGADVLDPCMGSGATLRAAKDLGRKAIGIELEERYCEDAAKQCAQEVLGLEAA